MCTVLSYSRKYILGIKLDRIETGIVEMDMQKEPSDPVYQGWYSSKKPRITRRHSVEWPRMISTA